MPTQVHIAPNGQASGLEFIQLRSSEVDEVLSQPPAWLVRWGITVFFFVLLVLASVAWFVKYPDLVKGSLQIIGDDYPKSVNAQVDAKLVKLLVKEGQIVTKKQHLAYLESTANVEEVLALETAIDSLIKYSQTKALKQIYGAAMPLYFQLGELQKPFQAFQDSYVRGRGLLVGGAFDQKQAAIENDLVQLHILENNLDNQLINHRSDLSLAEADLVMTRKLHRDRTVSDVDMRRSQSIFIGKKQVLDQAQTAFNNNGMAQNQKQQEILELTGHFHKTGK